MNRDRLQAQLKVDEGTVLHLYYDSKGIPSIGTGRNLRVGISEVESDFLLDNDIDAAYADLIRAFPYAMKMDDVRQEVLLNMTFNLGIEGLLQFHKMLAAVTRADYAGAAAEMELSEWYEEVGNRAVRLCAAMRLGQFPNS